MMRILYATDGSEGALAAAPLLNSLPLDEDCELVILTVVPPGDEAKGQAAVTTTRDALSHCTAGLTPLIRHGHVADTILRTAEEHPTSLIVVGSRGLSAITRFFLGSVAERVARHASCSVLLARPLVGELDKLIIGVDGSPDAERAVEWVKQFPLPPECEIRLVQVLPFLEDLIRARMLLPPHLTGYQEAYGFAERQQQGAQTYLEKLAVSLTGAERQTTTETRRGEPASALLDAVEEQKADLLIVGCQGLSAIERFVMGSVSENVLRHARCSVVVVR
jgi:nucleotide-binding universal stress UspA family protein